VAAYDPDTLRVIPRPASQLAKVAYCLGIETILDDTDLAWAAFTPGAAVPGCNPCLKPCDVTQVLPETWSGIKTRGRLADLGRQ
jgi:hypothetical protein